jgi:hypothetical protein
MPPRTSILELTASLDRLKARGTREPQARFARHRYVRDGYGILTAESRDLARGTVCRCANATSRIDAILLGDSEVSGDMTANWAATVVNVLILAFFVVVAIGVGLGAYAATEMKKAEEAKRES